MAIAEKAAADVDKGKSASTERVQRLEAELKSLRNLYGFKRDLGTSAGEPRVQPARKRLARLVRKHVISPAQAVSSTRAKAHSATRAKALSATRAKAHSATRA